MGKVIATLPAVCCKPGSVPLGPKELGVLTDQFAALADPTRLGIVNRLAASEELCVCVLNADFEISQPTMSHHLKVLREAGLIEGEKRGRWSYYWLRQDAIKALAKSLAA